MRPAFESLSSGIQQSARGIDAHQQQRGVFRLGLFNGMADDFDGYRMDLACYGYRDYTRCGPLSERGHSSENGE